MAASNNKRTAAPARMPSDLDNWSQSAKTQMEFGLRVMLAMLRSAEEMRKLDFDSVHLARLRHEELQQRLRDTTDPSQLVALQSDLLRFDAASATRFWQELFDVGVRMNTEMLKCVTDVADIERGDFVKSMFETMVSSMHTGIRPLDDLFNAHLNRDLVGAGSQVAVH